MSASDRLDQIQQQYLAWHDDRGYHTPAPYSWRADPGESIDHYIVRQHVPELVSALRAVLDVCGEVEDQHHPDRMYEAGMEEMAHRVLVAIHKTLGETTP